MGIDRSVGYDRRDNKNDDRISFIRSECDSACDITCGGTGIGDCKDCVSSCLQYLKDRAVDP